MLVALQDIEAHVSPGNTAMDNCENPAPAEDIHSTPDTILQYDVSLMVMLVSLTSTSVIPTTLRLIEYK